MILAVISKSVFARDIKVILTRLSRSLKVFYKHFCYNRRHEDLLWFCSLVCRYVFGGNAFDSVGATAISQ